MDKIVALIPVRGGSKSIPRKNIRELSGQPLVYWTLDAAVNCELIEKVYIATDDDEIGQVVEAYGHPKVTVIGRSAETATDTASTESVMLEFAAAYQFDHLVLIQATSPLLQSEHLVRGIERYLETKADGLVSVVRQKRFLWQEDERGVASPINYDPLKRPRRQDFDGFLVENGAFYISRKRRLLESGSRLSGSIICYEMSEESYFELDEPSDWQIVAGMLQGEKSKKKESLVDFSTIKLVLTDVDGVLTDAGMYYGNSGDELKKFNTRDGKGFELLKKAGLQVGIITGEDNLLVEQRAAKLKVDFLFQGVADKVKVLVGLMQKMGLSADEVAYIGDDINDTALLSMVGLAAAPADAVEQNLRVAHYLCRLKGGEGCFREFAEYILSSR